MSEPKKLYEIEVSTILYVLADGEDEAIDIAQEAISDGDVEIEAGDIDAFQITDSRLVNAKWRTAYPFNGGNDTCEQIAAAWEGYERTRPRTAKELEAMGQQSLISS